MKSSLFWQFAYRLRIAIAVALGNFLANNGQWKSSNLSDQALSSSHTEGVNWVGITNMCFASLHYQNRCQIKTCYASTVKEQPHTRSQQG
jgi:hypothetical protein